MYYYGDVMQFTTNNHRLLEVVLLYYKLPSHRSNSLEVKFQDAAASYTQIQSHHVTLTSVCWNKLYRSSADVLIKLLKHNYY